MAIIGDLTAPGAFDNLVQDVDVVVHVASVSSLPPRCPFNVPVIDEELCSRSLVEQGPRMLNENKTSLYPPSKECSRSCSP